MYAKTNNHRLLVVDDNPSIHDDIRKILENSRLEAASLQDDKERLKPFDNIEVLQLAHALTEKWRLDQEVKNHFRELDQLFSQRATELEAANARLRAANELLQRKVDELENRFLPPKESAGSPLANIGSN
jgi:hypothetical protein